MRCLLATLALTVAISGTTLAAQRTPGQNAPANAAASNKLKAELTGLERAAIASQLVRTFASDVRARGQDVHGWAVKLGRQIGTADAVNVQQAATMPTLNSAMAVLMGQQVKSSSIQRVMEMAAAGDVVAASLGDPLADLTYTPLPNGRCRVADSRTISSPLTAGITRGIDTEDTSSYASQGGTGSSAGQGSTNCGIPSFVAAVVVSVTVLPTSSTGFFKIFSNDQTFTDGNTVQWSNFGGATNDVIVKSCQSCALELSIYASGSTHYVLDVLGYYIRPQATALQCVDTADTVVSVAAGATANASAPACAAGYTQTSTNCESSTWQMPFVFFSGGVCSAQNNSAGTASIRASRTCCRVPGR